MSYFRLLFSSLLVALSLSFSVIAITPKELQKYYNFITEGRAVYDQLLSAHIKFEEYRGVYLESFSNDASKATLQKTYDQHIADATKTLEALKNQKAKLHLPKLSEKKHNKFILRYDDFLSQMLLSGERHLEVLKHSGHLAIEGNADSFDEMSEINLRHNADLLKYENIMIESSLSTIEPDSVQLDLSKILMAVNNAHSNHLKIFSHFLTSSDMPFTEYADGIRQSRDSIKSILKKSRKKNIRYFKKRNKILKRDKSVKSREMQAIFKELKTAFDDAIELEEQAFIPLDIYIKGIEKLDPNDENFEETIRSLGTSFEDNSLVLSQERYSKNIERSNLGGRISEILNR